MYHIVLAVSIQARRNGWTQSWDDLYSPVTFFTQKCGWDCWATPPSSPAAASASCCGVLRGRRLHGAQSKLAPKERSPSTSFWEISVQYCVDLFTIRFRTPEPVIAIVGSMRVRHQPISVNGLRQHRWVDSSAPSPAWLGETTVAVRNVLFPFDRHAAA